MSQFIYFFVKGHLDIGTYSFGVRGWKLRKKGKKKIGYPTHMFQTPRADMRDSAGWFLRYLSATLSNYNTNLSMCRHFVDEIDSSSG